MIRCIKFRSYEKNTLRGFADLELVQTGLVLRDCTWHQHENGREWVSFPARSFTADDGTTKWQPLVEFASGAKEARGQFQKQALAAIHAVADAQGAAA